MLHTTRHTKTLCSSLRSDTAVREQLLSVQNTMSCAVMLARPAARCAPLDSSICLYTTQQQNGLLVQACQPTWQAPWTLQRLRGWTP